MQVAVIRAVIRFGICCLVTAVLNRTIIRNAFAVTLAVTFALSTAVITPLTRTIRVAVITQQTRLRLTATLRTAAVVSAVVQAIRTRQLRQATAIIHAAVADAVLVITTTYNTTDKKKAAEKFAAFGV